ncbi:Unknown protein, partial [Striga hermonthica]
GRFPSHVSRAASVQIPFTFQGSPERQNRGKTVEGFLSNPHLMSFGTVIWEGSGMNLHWNARLVPSPNITCTKIMLHFITFWSYVTSYSIVMTDRNKAAMIFTDRFLHRCMNLQRRVWRERDPRIVDEWIQGLEFIFEVMECPDRYRVVCAQLQLTGDARLWWNAYWSMRPGENAGCTWDMFKELVRDKYYPSYYRAEMERQFLALQQGTRTVDEYEREFTRLAGFALDLVRTEAQRAQRFIDELYPAVRHNIVGHGTQTYARAVSIAQEVDASIRREAVRIVPSHLPQLSHLQLHQLYQPLSQPRRRRGRERVHRRTGGLDRDSSQFHRARLV